MNEAYYFLNFLNLFLIIGGILSIGLICGALLSSMIAMLIQINDQAISTFIKSGGFILGAYFSSSVIFENFKMFSINLWGGQ